MNAAWAILWTSLVLWVWRAAEFALIGRHAPLIALIIGLALLGWGYQGTGARWKRALRAWGVAILLAGVARAALSAGLYADPGVSQHGREALTLPYHASSLFHLIGGLWLIVRPPIRSPGTEK